MTGRTAARRITAWLPVAGVLGLIASCAVGPDYKRPPFATAPAYKEEEGWKPSEPSDAMSRGSWWTIFGDQVLDQLEAKVDVSNENVKAAVAAYDQAKALVDQARAGFWPTVSGSAARIRSESSAGSFTTLPTGGNGASTGSTVISARSTTTTYSAGVTADWTLDIWGQIRRTVESDKASAQASAAALAAARLSAQTTLATDYIELRAQDQLQKLLDDTVVAEQLSLKITESRYRFGVAAKPTS